MVSYAECEDIAAHVLYNLQYEHGWTHLHLNTRRRSAASESGPAAAPAPATSPRPTVSGLPPKRLYVHPDDQLRLLVDKAGDAPAAIDALTPEVEHVLPVHVAESLTLATLAAVFDSLGQGDGSPESRVEEADALADDGVAASRPRRLVLAVVHDDSTVIYYIMHDGIVKPRQN